MRIYSKIDTRKATNPENPPAFDGISLKPRQKSVIFGWKIKPTGSVMVFVRILGPFGPVTDNPRFVVVIAVEDDFGGRQNLRPIWTGQHG